MASSAVTTSRAVEVLHHRGPARMPQWTVGSAYLVGGRYVLTAAHAVDYRQALGADERLLVRRRWAGEDEYSARVVAAGTEQADLALVEIDDPAFADAVTPVRWARVHRDDPRTVWDCWAVGFPAFKEKQRAGGSGVKLRDSVHVGGGIKPGSNRVSEMLELEVTSRPQELSRGRSADSQWQGMSGAVVFAPDSDGGHVAVGVVVEHHLPEGVSSLTVAPVTALAALVDGQPDSSAAHGARGLLVVGDPDRWPRLPHAHAPGRARADLTTLTGAPRAAGNPAGYVFDAKRTQHVNYRGTDDHVHELRSRENGWEHTDLTTEAAGAPPATGDPVGYVFSAESTQHVNYRSADGHIHELWWRKGHWHHTDLTTTAGAPPATGDPVGYVFSAESGRHVNYRSADGHIHELWW
ncbi:trypsin-like serine protease, partial [Frankia sp. CiP3]|uniref:trypsin-like serine protease n=1 Tax=Frankia sp. CiP3 TaxID=2880971 RepID=UPI001EF456B6